MNNKNIIILVSFILVLMWGFALDRAINMRDNIVFVERYIVETGTYAPTIDSLLEKHSSVYCTHTAVFSACIVDY